MELNFVGGLIIRAQWQEPRAPGNGDMGHLKPGMLEEWSVCVSFRACLYEEFCQYNYAAMVILVQLPMGTLLF